RDLARISITDLDVRGRHPDPAGAMGHRFRRTRARLLADRHDGLHVQSEFFVVPARAVAVSRLAAVHARLPGVETRLRPTRAAGLDRHRLGPAAGLLLPDAAAAPRPGPDAGEHQLCVGHERPGGADLGLA